MLFPDDKPSARTRARIGTTTTLSHARTESGRLDTFICLSCLAGLTRIEREGGNDMKTIWNCDECNGKDCVAEIPEQETYACMDCGIVYGDISEFTIQQMDEPQDHIWVCPTSGEEYIPGDIIPVRHTVDGAYFNEPVIVVHCPGFPGGIVETGGVEVPLPRMEPTQAFFVGPASAAWAWQYRQGQYMVHLSTQRRMGDMIE